MPRVTDIYSSPYATAAELVPIGQRRSAIIHAVAQENVGPNRDPKLVLSLVGPNGRPWPKGVVLNKTNALHLKLVYGNDSDDWLGKPIEIWSENVSFQGRIVPGIRLAPKPQQPAVLASNGQGNPAIPPATDAGPALDDEIPF
jgi:hypothetical protein